MLFLIKNTKISNKFYFLDEFSWYKVLILIIIILIKLTYIKIIRDKMNDPFELITINTLSNDIKIKSLQFNQQSPSDYSSISSGR